MIQNKVNPGQSKSGEFYIDCHVMMLKGLIFIFRDFATAIQYSLCLGNVKIRSRASRYYLLDRSK